MWLLQLRRSNVLMLDILTIFRGYIAEPVRFRYVAPVQSKTKTRGKTPNQIQQLLAEKEAASEVRRGLNSYFYG